MVQWVKGLTAKTHTVKGDSQVPNTQQTHTHINKKNNNRYK